MLDMIHAYKAKQELHKARIGSSQPDTVVINFSFWIKGANPLFGQVIIRKLFTEYA